MWPYHVEKVNQTGFLKLLWEVDEAYSYFVKLTEALMSTTYPNNFIYCLTLSARTQISQKF